MNALMTTASMNPMTDFLGHAHQAWKLCLSSFLLSWLRFGLLLVDVGVSAWLFCVGNGFSTHGPPAAIAPVVPTVPAEVYDVQPQASPAVHVKKKIPAAKAALKKTMPPAPAPAKTPAQIPIISQERNASVFKPKEAPRVDAPVGQVVALPGVTVLANESGQDTLKHGAEARFMRGVATDEFVEENYVGEYSLGAAGRVWIEDDRGRSGHLNGWG